MPTSMGTAAREAISGWFEEDFGVAVVEDGGEVAVGWPLGLGSLEQEVARGGRIQRGAGPSQLVELARPKVGLNTGRYKGLEQLRALGQAPVVLCWSKPRIAVEAGEVPAVSDCHIGHSQPIGEPLHRVELHSGGAGVARDVALPKPPDLHSRSLARRHTPPGCHSVLVIALGRYFVLAWRASCHEPESSWLDLSVSVAPPQQEAP